MDLALDIRSLSKRYGDKQAVNELNLQVKPGEFYALLGQNGAGKTTTLRIVAGLLEADSGDVYVAGHHIKDEEQEAKRQLAYLPDEPLLYDKLKVLEYLEFVAGLWGIAPEVAQPRAEELLKGMNLWEVKDNNCESLSRGMKQKLMLAGAFIHEPKLMILDEPLLGLDAAASKLVKDMLADYIAAGNSVVMTTHIMEIAERIATRIGIFMGGKLLIEGTLVELSAAVGSTEGTLEDIFLQATSGDRPFSSSELALRG